MDFSGGISAIGKMFLYTRVFRRKMNSMVLKSFFICLYLFAFVASPMAFGVGCNQACSNHTDCDQETCRECLEIAPGVNRCSSCCDHEEEFDCASPCVWSGDQCQNVSGVDCSGIPEVPENNKTRTFLISLMLGFGTLWVLKTVKKKS